MQTQLRFSIIIPTYNRGSVLSVLLDSLAKQSYKSFEVIICDDGSTDSTSEVISNYVPQFQIHYIKLNNNGGPAAPRNVGIRHANGEFCAFLDSDDEWYPNKLDVVNENLKHGYDWVYHDLDIFSGNKQMGLLKARNYDKRNPVQSLLTGFNPIGTSSMVIRTSLLKKVGDFNEDTAYHFVEDFDYWLRLVNVNTNSMAINDSLGIYHDHEVNNSKNDLQIARLGRLYDDYNVSFGSTAIVSAKLYAQFSLSYNARNRALCGKLCSDLLKVRPFHLNTIKALAKWILR